MAWIRLFFLIIRGLLFGLPLAIFRALTHCVLPGVSIGKGFGYLEKGQPAKAEGVARKLLAKGSFPVEARHLLGHALLEQKRPEEAAEAFRTALKLDDSSEEAYLNLGVALDQAGHYHDAIAQLPKRSN